MKTILVPTDFSENAENAMYYAIDIAKKIHAKIILANVYQITYSTSYVPVDLIVEEKIEAKKDSELKLKAAALKIKHAGKIEHDLICVEGFVVDEILDLIKKHVIDVVIMGTKGATNIIDTIFGSNTAKVIENASCPIIAVPEKALFKGIEKITYATDYQNCDIQALNKVIELFRSFNAKINILHIAENSDSSIFEKGAMKEFKEEVLAKAPYDKMSFQILKGDVVEEALEEYVNEGNVDMLVLAARHRDFLDKLFGSSVSKHMAYHISIPLMVFHYQNRSSEQVF